MRFENGEITDDGVLKDKICPYSVNSRPCGTKCPHFGKPEEVIVTHRHQRHIAEDFTYSHEKTGEYFLKICQGTKIKLGRILLK